MNIVLDTNVIVSALINSEGTPAQILNLSISGKIILLYDNRILSEYEEVLKREKFGFEKEWVNVIIDFIKNEGEFIAAEPLSSKFEDEADKKFYEVAKSGNAKYLITGNKKHYPKEKLIVTPKEYIEKNY